MGKQLLIAEKEKPFPAGAFLWRWQFGDEMDQWICLFQKPRERGRCLPMPRRNAILDVAGDLFRLLMTTIAESLRAIVYILFFFPLVCSYAHAAHMTHMRGYVSACNRVDVQTWLIRTSLSRAVDVSNHGARLAGLFQSAVLLRSSAPPFPRRVGSSGEAASFIMTWHARRAGWRGGGVMGWREEWGGGRGGSFSLQQALFSPRSPGHHTPAGTHLIMHPVWRRGQNGTEKKKVSCDRLCTLEKLLHNTSAIKLQAWTERVQWIYM